MTTAATNAGAHIAGFRFTGFRSFDDIAQFDKLAKINLLVGQNNSGKSNVLRFISKVLSTLVPPHKVEQTSYSFGFEDKPRGSDPDLKVELLVEGTMWHGPKLRDEQLEELGTFADSAGWTTAQGTKVWIAWQAKYGGNLERLTLPAPDISDELFGKLQRLGNTHHPHKSQITKYIRANPSDWDVPPIVQIPAFRSLDRAAAAPDTNVWDGFDLVKRLGTLQNPPDAGTALYEQRKGEWAALRTFVAGVLQSPDLELEIPQGGKTIHIDLDGRTMPIEAVGSGLHQLVMIAAACVLTKDSVILLEEPEVHMHPLLTRKLALFLASETSNQYFIATHSPHLIDLADTRTFRVGLQDGWSKIDPVDASTDVLNLLSDLGYRSSDLLQTNCVVWVEGPSDLIYVRHWMSQIDPDLTEDVHYSVMFYGGANVHHVSGASNESQIPNDLVRLRKLNQHSALIADSDRRSDGDALKLSVERVVDEFKQGHGYAWVTQGREVENYVPGDTMLAAIQANHPRAQSLVAPVDPFGCRYEYVGGQGAQVTELREGKPALAREVVARQPSLDNLDLRERLVELSQFIRKANGLESLGTRSP